MVAPKIAAGHHLTVEVYGEVREDHETGRPPDKMVVDELLDELPAVVADLIEVMREGDDLESIVAKGCTDARCGRARPRRRDADPMPHAFDLLSGGGLAPHHPPTHIHADPEYRQPGLAEPRKSPGIEVVTVRHDVDLGTRQPSPRRPDKVVDSLMRHRFGIPREPNHTVVVD